jgi:hypothetical protein
VKNLLVANFRPHGRVKETELRGMVEAQIENSLAVGWQASDIVVVTNLTFDAPVTLVRAPLNESCLTGSKMFALEHLFSLGMIREDEMWWAHDLDAWQNFWFDEPEIADIGLTEYSRPSFNGGSVFLRASSRDLIQAITDQIRQDKMMREEPAIDRVLRRPAHAKRVTVLNSTYNVGCSAYAVRYQRSNQPILVSHFHPRGISWRTHVWGWNSLNTPSVVPRLVAVLVRRFYRGADPTPSASDWRKYRPRHYRLRESFHLGDSWARLNYALRLLEQGEQFSIYLPNQMTRDIFGLLDIGSVRPALLPERQKPNADSKRLFDRIDKGAAAYQCRYFPTKVGHKPEGLTIGYTFDAQWQVEQKVHPNLKSILEKLRERLPSYTLKPIGQPHQKTVPEVVAALAGLQLLIAVDNGIAHVARSVGVPLFLVEHNWPLLRGFPVENCIYTKVTVEDAEEKIFHYTRSVSGEE